MVDAADVPRILSDAARLLGAGELFVFGSAALAMRLPVGPRTRDVDVWCLPAERGDLITALMGEVSWYQDKHDAYVEVWGPETFAAPEDWQNRAWRLTNEDTPAVTLVVPHPHDVLVSKLERWEPQDREHAKAILASAPLTVARLDALLSQAPYRTGRIVDAARVRRFEVHAAELRAALA
ncbi:hypothetical protein LBMAG42_10680 [Deltaproteobacteria bacterium]|nr:hypothetical protein LBMAG42_10680 [Deltaproteobacteria bacterium]